MDVAELVDMQYPEILEKAGKKDADMIIAVTFSDNQHDNMSSGSFSI